MDMTRQTAERVGALLDEAGLTALAVSEQAGIPRTTLGRRLTGTSPFTVAELDSIARVLNKPLHSLLPATDNHGVNAA